MPAPFRVLLVDDDPYVRQALSLMLGPASDLEVVGEASDGDEVPAAIARHHPDVILMDLIMARVGGIDAIKALRTQPDAPAVIALTTWNVDDAVVSAIEAGADGFLLKGAAPAEITGAIRAVMSGDAVLSPHATRQLLSQFAERRQAMPGPEQAAAQSLFAALTPRERDVAISVGHGWSNAEIGRALFLSEATVKTHLSAVQNKLGVENRVRVAVLAERAGLLRNQ